MRRILTILLVFAAWRAKGQAFSPQWVFGPGEYINVAVNKQTGVSVAINGTARPISTSYLLSDCAGGAHHSLFIGLDGFPKAVGDNTNGECGIGNTTYQSSIVNIPTDSSGASMGGTIQVVAGAAVAGGSNYGWTSMFLNNQGQVRICGATVGGMRGNGTAGTTVVTKPVLVTFPAGVFIKKIQGATYGMALDSSGNVWTWGGNLSQYNGQYPLGRSGSNLTPATVTLPAGHKAIDISGGGYWNWIILDNGHVIGASCFMGYLGIGYGNTSGTGNVGYETPDASTKGLQFLLTDTTAGWAPFYTGGHYAIELETNQCGTLALRDDHTLWFVGDNALGNAGIGTELDFRHYHGANGYTPYEWDVNPGELLIRTLVQVAPGKSDWQMMRSSTSNQFYWYAWDSKNQIFSWGRNKAGMIMNRVTSCDSIIGNIQSVYPNSWDITLPTLVRFDSSRVLGITTPLCVDSSAAQYCGEGSCGVPGSLPAPSAGLQLSADGDTVFVDMSSTMSKYFIQQWRYDVTSSYSPPTGIRTGIKDTIYHVALDSTLTIQATVTDQYWQTATASASITLTNAPYTQYFTKPRGYKFFLKP